MTTPVCRFVVSACLAGEFCRYDGGSNACAAVQELVRRGEAVTACPEGLACLPVPRPPCEIREGRVLSQDGRDLTEDFLRGARLAMETARRHGCTAAILKRRSPSCGVGQIYDGTFSGTLTEGWGTAAALLRANGIRVLGESDLQGLLRELDGAGQA